MHSNNCGTPAVAHLRPVKPNKQARIAARRAARRAVPVKFEENTWKQNVCVLLTVVLIVLLIVYLVCVSARATAAAAAASTAAGDELENEDYK